MKTFAIVTFQFVVYMLTFLAFAHFMGLDFACAWGFAGLMVFKK